MLNADGGGVTTRDGKPVIVDVDASEKLYADFQLTVTNPGGHSSLPVPTTPSTTSPTRWRAWSTTQFPFELNDVTRAYFERTRATRKRPDRPRT